jgi:hypothetical protein
LPAKPEQLISPNKWPARRPDGQAANAESEPAPTVKGSSARPGTDKITARVPTQKARKFKLLCLINHWKQAEVIEQLLDAWFESLSGRPDGQTAIYQIRDDLTKDDDVPSSSSLPLMRGRPDGQPELAAKRRDVLAYYVRLTGNPIRQNDRDFLETILELPIWAIQCGIGMSVFKCKTPLHDPHVGSLRYCANAIAEVAESGVGEGYFHSVERALVKVGKLTLPEPKPPAQQPALPGASEAGELIDLKRKEHE